MTLRLMSNNKWRCDDNQPYWKKHGLDCSAAVREKGFASFYEKSQPDVIGMQEVSPLMLECLLGELKERNLPYAALWGRDTPILWRTDRLELVDADFLVYPKTIPGLEGEFNNENTKSYCVVVFREKADGKIFVFMTTHLWWMSENPESGYYQAGSDQARVWQLQRALDRLDDYQKTYNCPQIIVGDFNTVYDSEPIQAAFRRGFLHAHDVAVEYSDETNGHHPLGPDIIEPYNPRSFREGIDHILVRDIPEGAVRRFERSMPEEYLLLSDHAPVWIDITF